tara:strand:+ start:2909 stop:9019 length:6111 start_codon:yes stop_codon:yes gene_type:complete
MAKQNNKKGTTSVVTNSFIKGMNKDITQSMEPEQSWWNARNAANNSNDGDLGTIGNEPSNLQCGVIPYTIIGAVHRYGDEWIIFSTDNISSEIGRFDDSECKYTIIINDSCLAFNTENLITGASKENFDCTWEVYFDDGNNPSRALNIDDVPYIQYISSAEGDPCVVYSDVTPKRLNCEKIRLAPLVDTPCVVLQKSTDGGMMQNGAYQAFIAYTENEQRVTDFIGISNIQTLWSHVGTDGSLDINISNLDKDYEFFELALLVRNQGQTFAKRIGLYSTERQSINLDYLDDSLLSVDLKLIPQRSPAYEKSEAMYVVNDWLIRQGPTEQFDFNYQPIANNITTQFVVNEVSSTYYSLGGNKLGFLRDEQYAFFIRWIYNTGERSSSYHIPGRAPEFYAPAGQNEDVKIFGDNVLDPDGDPVFKVYNTGTVTSLVNEIQPDGSRIIAKGKMGYWQSTERYPSNRPDIWGDLCGKPIRHHKMPAEDASNSLHISTTSGDLINVLGVQFGNIGRPKYNDGTYLPNVVGYELLRGSRGGAKSILGKGLFRNMRKYTVPNAENLIGNDVQGLYPNYPYNDLRPDIYFHKGGNNNINRTEGCNSFTRSIIDYPALGADGIVDGVQTGYSQKAFTFSSPDLMFTKPFLNAYETRIYGDLNGQSSGYFKASEDHPQFKLLRNGAAVIAAFIGVGYAIGQVSGTTSEEITSSAFDNTDNTMTFIGIAGVGNSPGAAMVPIAIAQTAAGVAQAIANPIYKNALSGFSLADLWSGGAPSSGANSVWMGIQQASGLVPGIKQGQFNVTSTNDTMLSNIPPVLKLFATIATTGTNIAIGGNEIIELIYNLVNKSDFVYKYNSQGFYNSFTKRNTGLWRIKNTDSNYIGQSFQSFDNGKYKINNLFRPSTVAVALDKEISEPSVEDTSRFVIGGEVNKNNAAIPYDEDYLTDPDRPQKRPISAYYGALKFNFDNQYGQLDGIKQIPMRACVEQLDPTKPDAFMYTSSAIFSGDTFITRYTEKVMMPIFAQYLYGQPDEFTYDYSAHVNIPYPRYWLNSQKFDLSKLAQNIATLGLSSIGDSTDPTLPNDLYYLDRGSDSCSPVGIGSVFNRTGDPNPVLAMRYAYSYTHSNGILDFFVESEINLAQRDWEDTKEKRIYDVYQYNDLTDLFHAQIQKIDNFYKYDESLSPSKFPSQLSSWGQMQGRFYDPYVAENCYVARPKRLIYSLQAQEESKKDYWRVFLNFNYKDFKSKVNVIKPINKSGAIIFFPYLSPQMFQGLDTLKTGLDTKLTIGDGGLFSQPFQNIANSDLSNEYGSCESLRSVINTPMGLFYISQAQGKIFNYAGKGLEAISNNGMKWWFEQYLPSQLIKQYPALEQSVLSDNPIAGVGCQTIYDQNDDIVYFTKKDYRVKSGFISQITWNEETGWLFRNRDNITLGNPIFFEDCSWTISYDPKAKAWISFHDWHPEFCLPSINHFFTTKTITTDIPQCPPGYTFNSENGLCEIAINTTELSEVLVDNVAATIGGGPTNCLVDVVISMDVSGSTGQADRRAAQQTWMTAFLNNPQIQLFMSNSQMQIGFDVWDNNTATFNMNNPAGGTVTMSHLVTESQATAFMNANWFFGNSTNVLLGLQTGNAILTNPANSTLGDRRSNPNYRAIHIFVTDTTTAPGNNVGQVFTSVGAGTAPAYQFVYAMYCGANSSTPPSAGVLDDISMSSGPVNVDPYQYGINASDPTTFQAVATAIAGSVCGTDFTCDCPAGYTKVFLDPVTSTYTATSGACDDVTPPICRKVTCECPPATVPGTVVTETGICPNTSPKIYQIGDPAWVDPTPKLCNYFFYESVVANYNVGSLWRHNERCDSYANFYGIDYPWEVELVANTGQQVNTLRSIEYQMQAFVYKGVMGNACGEDKWEDLLFNFDEAVIYNSEQVSGLLKLTPTPFNNPILELSYPIINANNIDVLCSKVEQKYRFNQFWDITNDRGEFTNAEQPIWKTECNGYIKNLNTVNLNYLKSPLQHKKFRSYYTNLILKRSNSGNRKMLLRLNNTKLLISIR